ncbi:hypothetical protein KUTeg_024200 [Tegillarca granosa]|uniref:Uncharacterized protein n=1 Tax=Tegillarca granosa TaxID=220873 RepID=A0ABQ9DX74_TEGGR|nr:hypothetical protein KUTeg_024200 [Tegillarca granosa]
MENGRNARLNRMKTFDIVMIWIICCLYTITVTRGQTDRTLISATPIANTFNSHSDYGSSNYAPNYTHEWLIHTNYENHTLTLTFTACEMEYVYDAPSSEFNIIPIIAAAVGLICLILIILIIVIACKKMKNRNNNNNQKEHTITAFQRKQDVKTVFFHYPPQTKVIPAHETNIFDFDLPQGGRGNKLPPMTPPLNGKMRKKALIFTILFNCNITYIFVFEYGITYYSKVRFPLSYNLVQYLDFTLYTYRFYSSIIFVILIQNSFYFLIFKVNKDNTFNHSNIIKRNKLFKLNDLSNLMFE